MVIKLTEHFVATKQETQLPPALIGTVRQKQPEILNRRAAHHVIEIYDHDSFPWPVEQVAAMAVAVDSDELGVVEQILDVVKYPRCDILEFT